MSKKFHLDPGMRFGRLSVMSEADPNITPSGQTHRYANCICDCGKSKRIKLSHLRSGLTQSCGCLNREKVNKTKTSRSQIENFEQLTKISMSGYIEWQGRKSFDGYGRIWVDGKEVGAHRAAYIKFVGEIPEGLYVCHSCDNRLCVNPDHLWLGTHQDNMDDMRRKKRGVGQDHQGGVA